MKKLRNIGSRIAPIIFFVLLIILWELIVHINGVKAYILPSPSVIMKALIKDSGLLLEHSKITMYEAFLGFLIAILLSLALSIIMDAFTLIKKCLYPLIIVSQTVPIIALAPLFIIWFGFGIMPKVIVVVMVCFFPMVISLVDGMASVDEEYINHFRLMGANKIQIFFNLKLPYGLINFFSGMRIAATYSIMGAIIGEWLGGEKGLGIYMVRAKSAYALDKVFAAIIIVVVLSIICVNFIKFIEKIATPWKKINNKR
ncbi:ABC-type nitrate/sulfonate/bicarbonate transport system, permease component [Clostridium cavendishii DSM 21758]|uniref:ABC-type nitrate/sulfonate/bicarbonate transport system, permease component n=1 Tax=Clostridium cavendishii DSM 21758 TaxID=1121302 RepID=A0A1M6I934_9CLOT|nr:ABC transporter permease [Clostridium cavendishii]SHJ31019.1 ABC-type nitrate/sulfonate/bicarbonate transport system, permease component [Clostridium cavendishii DSM 21758]